MKTKIFLSLSALLLIIGTYFSCSKTQTVKAAEVDDVVNGPVPVDVHDIEWRKRFIQKLKPLTADQRKVEIEKALPHLNTSLAMMLQNHGYNCEFKITYVFGSGNADSVKSGDGKYYRGGFKDQLYAIVKGPCFKDSLITFVQCFNGVFVIEGENQQIIGTYNPIFTIEKGRGLNWYVEYFNAIDLAEAFNLPLHRGQGWKGPLVTPTQARALYPTLGERAVTVEVYEGDIFNVGDMTYTHNGKVMHARKK